MRNFFIAAFTLLCLGASGQQVAVRVGQPSGRKISDKLLGFNIVYCNSPDEVWATGKLQKEFKAMNVGMLRWPGGTVCTFFHWQNPTGVGWEDSWKPGYSTPNAPASDFVGIDEYMAIVRASGAEPLVGINVNSGFIYDRVDDGIKEALALMKYCKDKGFKVTYWYMGNEPYQHDCNGGANTPEQYAEKINAFAGPMRKFDPSIRLIANWRAGFDKEKDNYRKLFELAGKNIDVIDVHNYWAWGNTSWDLWKSKPMGVFTGTSYMEEIATFRKMAAEFGYPDAKLATLEWNVGPSGRTPSSRLNPAQAALGQSEMLMQFMMGGMDYATFWPLFWKGDSFRSYYDIKKQELQPIADIFRVMGNFGGGQLLDCSGSGDKLMYMVLRDRAGATRICALNKGDAPLDVSFSGLPSGKVAENFQFALSGSGDALKEGKAAATGNLSVKLVPNSLTILTIK